MSENISRNKFIDLKINGRLFPSWVMANYKRYKIPEIMKTDDEDPCNKKTKNELRSYQLFLSKYLDFKSPYRDILIYHGMGSGKTATTINIYNVLYNYTPGWNVFLLIKASLKDDPWLDNLKKWLSKDENEFRMNNIIFIHYDSPFADRDFLEAIRKADSSKKSLFIIEEAHNFISNVYSNISSQQGKRASVIYDYIQQARENDNTRIIALSATPAINQPFELALLFNLLRPNSMPKNEAEFNKLYISNGSFKSINKANKNMFQRRILGLVSYYLGATPDYFARKIVTHVDVKMSKYHEEIYSIFEEKEEKIARRMRMSGKQSGTYKSYTRQSCNFVFPQIDQYINGEGRPRPGSFKITEREAKTIDTGKNDKLKLEKGTDKFMRVNDYEKALQNYTTGFYNYLREASDLDNSKGYTIKDDFEKFKKYSSFDEYLTKEQKRSNLFERMHNCSAKFTNCIFNIQLSKGPVLVYSNYVLMEGLEIFKIYMEFFGIVRYNKSDKNAYVEYHGGIDRKERKSQLQLFNRSENKFGELIKVILVSQAGSEGLNLLNVRQVHIIEPYWHEVRITQMIGRAIRLCSHKDLPMSDREVNVFRYKSVRNSGLVKPTTDEFIEDLARTKDSLIQSFLETLKEVSVDCNLNAQVNMMSNEYKCFQFDETSLFDKHIGPAYKEDIKDDMKMDNGSFGTNSQTLKIKVNKIKAVKLLSAPEQTPKYSKSDDYWFYKDSGVVYDYELKFPIGKIQINDNIPVKINKDTYVIDQVIPIPMIEE